MQFECAAFSSLFAEPQKNGLTRPKAVRGAGLPMVNMGELFAHRRIRHMEMDRVVVKQSEKSYILCPGDLLFARQSLVLSGAGKCSLFEACAEPTVFESHLIRCRLDRTKAEPRFYFYFFESPQGRVAMESIVEQGAGQAGIRASDLARLLVPQPPVTYQSAVADLLSTLDDRIDSLRTTSAQLEELARVVFKSWFVDFDPVRAKAAGREPESMDAATAALFPSSFAQSDQTIAVGWSKQPVSQVAAILGGTTPSTKHVRYWIDGEYHWATPKDLSKLTCPTLLDTERKITAQGLAQIGSGLLPRGTVLLSSRAPIGYLAVAEVPTAINQGFIAMKAHPNISNLFLWLWAESAMETIKSRANGSTFLEVSKSNFKSIEVMVPSNPVMTAFDAVARPPYERMVMNARMIETLTELREALLPRLISGKLRIPEAEKLVAFAL